MSVEIDHRREVEQMESEEVEQTVYGEEGNYRGITFEDKLIKGDVYISGLTDLGRRGEKIEDHEDYGDDYLGFYRSRIEGDLSIANYDRVFPTIEFQEVIIDGNLSLPNMTLRTLSFIDGTEIRGDFRLATPGKGSTTRIEEALHLFGFEVKGSVFCGSNIAAALQILLYSDFDVSVEYQKLNELVEEIVGIAGRNWSEQT